MSENDGPNSTNDRNVHLFKNYCSVDLHRSSFYDFSMIALCWFYNFCQLLHIVLVIRVFCVFWIKVVIRMNPDEFWFMNRSRRVLCTWGDLFRMCNAKILKCGCIVYMFSNVFLRYTQMSVYNLYLKKMYLM